MERTGGEMNADLKELIPRLLKTAERTAKNASQRMAYENLMQVATMDINVE